MYKIHKARYTMYSLYSHFVLLIYKFLDIDHKVKFITPVYEHMIQPRNKQIVVFLQQNDEKKMLSNTRKKSNIKKNTDRQ